MPGAGLEGRVVKSHVVLRQRASVAQRQGYPNPLEEDRLVHRVAQIIPVNYWFREGIVAGQSKSTWKNGESPEKFNYYYYYYYIIRTSAAGVKIRGRDADVTAAVVHQGSDEACRSASRLITAEEDLKVGVVRARVYRGHDPRQLGQTGRGDGPPHERDVLQGRGPVQVELVRAVYGERQRERDVVVQILADTYTKIIN